MKRPRWLRKDMILAVHQKTLNEQGGRPGIRDKGLLESALAKPLNSFKYVNKPDLFQLAAGYGFGVSSNHPFIDGNKRVAFYASLGFLRLNGVRFNAGEAEAAVTFLALAAGKLSEEVLASWLSEKSAHTSPDE